MLCRFPQCQSEQSSTTLRLIPGQGGQIARGSGTGATIAAKEGDYVHLRLPSGEVRKILSKGLATVGNFGNIEWKNRVF